jgi:hypothetical protein
VSLPDIAGWDGRRVVESEDEGLHLGARNRGTVEVSIELAWLGQLQTSNNDAELKLVETLVRALVDWLPIEIADPRATARQVVSTGARYMHIFAPASVRDLLLAGGPKPQARHLQVEDRGTWQTSFRYEMLTSPGRGLVSSKHANCKVLQDAVEATWNAIRSRLREVERLSVVEEALHNLESVAYERSRWQRTAAALLSLHGSQGALEAASGADADQASTALCTRVLVEMAVCTSPISGGRPFETTDLDFLLAGLDQILLLATQCDAIYHGLADPKLTISESGLVAMDRSYVARAVRPYIEGLFADRYRADAKDYERFVSGRTDEGGTPSVEPTLQAAFAAEFGLDVHQFLLVLRWAVATALEEKANLLCSSCHRYRG